MLNIDEDGKTPFSKAFEDPQTLVRAAWFILNGEEAFESISDYFTSQIKQVAEAQYNKGLEDGKKGNNTFDHVARAHQKTRLVRHNFAGLQLEMRVLAKGNAGGTEWGVCAARN